MEPGAPQAGEFVRAAITGQLDRAKLLLEGNANLAGADVYCAAVCGDADALRRYLRQQPALATATGGPGGEPWTLLHYVSFSAWQTASPEARQRFAVCAKILLEAGADPNAAWSDPHGPPAPLRALYGACGIHNNPELARVLLAGGAEVNDGEAIYHAAEHFHRECLDVLFEHNVSLGLHPYWKNTPLFFLLGHRENSAAWPRAFSGVRWLLEHGADPNVACGKEQETALHVAVRGRHGVPLLKLLLDSGANPGLPAQDGHSPLAKALIMGEREAVSLFRAHGAPEPALSPKEQFLAACFAGDTPKARHLLGEHPGLFTSLGEGERLSLGEAAQFGKIAAMETMLAAGFDLAFMGGQAWGATPLHQAAWHGQAGAVRLLLAHGAPVEIEANPPVQGSPLNWAAHGSTFCANPQGDYVGIVKMLMAAGAKVNADQLEMATPEVAAVLRPSLPAKA